MTKLRFHWDFFGPDAEPTAKHFVKHLGEFCERENIQEQRAWTTAFARRYVATLECPDEHLALVRDRLKPVRAERIG